MHDIALRTDRLTRVYGDVRAVDQVSLTVPRGTVYGFLGPNGAGKTTTIAMILGLQRPSAGRIALFGNEVTPTDTAPLRQVGSLVGSPGVEPHRSARDNLRLLSYLHPTVDRRRVDAVLEQVGLSDAADRRVKDYSLGMRQRLGLAVALIHRPALLILDEPTNGLDPAGMKEIRELLRSLPDLGVTVFLSSHLLHEIEQVCTHVAVLNQGRVVAQGRVHDLLAGEQRVWLRVPSALEAATALHSLHKAKVTRAEGHELVVSGVPSEAVLMHLMARGIVPSEVHQGQSDLEQFFFSLTEASSEQTPSQKGGDHVLEPCTG